MKARALVVDNGRDFVYQLLDGEHSGVAFVAGDQGAAEFRVGTEVTVQYHPADQYADLLSFRARIEDALRAAGLPVVFCGLNADWSACAWHLGPSNDPNRVDGDVYLLDSEEGEQVIVARKFPSRDDESAIEIVAEELSLETGLAFALVTLAAVKAGA